MCTLHTRIYVCMYICMHVYPQLVFPTIFFCVFPAVGPPALLAVSGLILLLHMYTYDPTYTYPKCILLIVNSLRVPRCRAPGAGCNFRLDLAARLCTLHVVLFYWLWLEHGVYGLHLHAGLFFYVSFFSVRYTCFFSIAYGLSMACMPLTCMLVSFFLFLFSLA